MARYRKIDPRIWNDENFLEAEPLHKLIWFALLTHPLMTPMGAGVIAPAMLDEIIGNSRDWCWKCEDHCKIHHADTILEWFEERSMILSSNPTGSGLVVIKNYLRYNCPENPNQLAGWIDCVEELPRSLLWKTLRDHLVETFDGPAWLFDGLLNPLADNKMHGLKALYWTRIQPSLKPLGRPSQDGSQDGVGEPSHKPGAVTGSGAVKETTPPSPLKGDGTPPPEKPQKKRRAKSKNMLIAYDAYPGFCQLWEMAVVRPNGSKGDKAEALKRWSNYQPSPETTPALLEQILNAYAYQRTTPEWQKNGGQYVPHLEVWIGIPSSHKWEGVAVPEGWTRHNESTPNSTGPTPQREGETDDDYRKRTWAETVVGKKWHDPETGDWMYKGPA